MYHTPNGRKEPDNLPGSWSEGWVARATLTLREGAEQMHLVDTASKIRGAEQAVSTESRCAGRQDHPVAPQATSRTCGPGPPVCIMVAASRPLRPVTVNPTSRLSIV